MSRMDDFVRRQALQAAMEQVAMLEQMAERVKNDRDETQAYRLSIRDPKTIVRDWVEDAKKKNGKRPHVCVKCKHSFLGNKKRKTCFDCEVTAHVIIPSYEDKDESASDPQASV